MRMPVEVELFRNHKHSTMGKELRAKLGNNPDRATMRKVYHTAQQMVDDMMETIASQAKDGQIDATDLDESSQEMLALYLEHQVRMLRPNTRAHTLLLTSVVRFFTFAHSRLGKRFVWFSITARRRGRRRLWC